MHKLKNCEEKFYLENKETEKCEKLTGDEIYNKFQERNKNQELKYNIDNFKIIRVNYSTDEINRFMRCMRECGVPPEFYTGNRTKIEMDKMVSHGGRDIFKSDKTTKLFCSMFALAAH